MLVLVAAHPGPLSRTFFASARQRAARPAEVAGSGRFCLAGADIAPLGQYLAASGSATSATSNLFQVSADHVTGSAGTLVTTSFHGRLGQRRRVHPAHAVRPRAAPREAANGFVLRNHNLTLRSRLPSTCDIASRS
jgi:hypothetical protein